MPKVRKTDLNEDDNLIKVEDDNYIIGYKYNIRKPQNKITVRDFKDRYGNVESILEQNVVIKYRKVKNEDGTITKVPKLYRNGSFQIKNTICSKANHGTSRVLPNKPQVVLKCNKYEQAFSVSLACYYSEIKPQGLFIPDYLKPRIKIPLQDQFKIIRYLAKKYGYKELAEKTDKELSDIFKDLRRRKELHRLEDIDKNAKKELKGYTQRIMDKYGLGQNRGVITDLCCWKWLLSTNQSENYFSPHCREQGIIVIPDELFYRFEYIMLK